MLALFICCRIDLRRAWPIGEVGSSKFYSLPEFKLPELERIEPLLRWRLPGLCGKS
jgi:hypothetical protein